MSKSFTPPDTSDLDDLVAGARNRFNSPPPEPEPQPAVIPPDRHDGTTADRHTVQRSKFTVLLEAADAEAFDELALAARRRTGRRIGKGELVRALIRLADSRPGLLDDLLPHLPEK